MSFEADEEILQDFLIEAGEILEEMSEQLVALENDPQNMDLLNGIFRGFHTVKGGAGFLNLKPLVDICHITENIFDILRNGDRIADAELMDHILQSLDLVNEMFESVRQGEQPKDASKTFLDKLGTYAKPGETSPGSSEAPVSQNSADSEGDITDAEFDALLDELDGNSDDKTPTESESDTNVSANDDITDDEFESLLDELHGQGGKPETRVESNSGASNTEDGLIDDSEFEALLDELHGTGKGPASTKGSTPTSSETELFDTSEPAEPVKPEPAVKAKPKETSKPIPPKKATKKVGNSKTTAKPVTPKSIAKPKGAKKGGAVVTEATVRVDTKRLDDIMNMVGELVLARNRLKTVAGEMGNNEDLSKAVANLDIVTGDLQGAVMKTRMQPIKKVFGRFPRVVRDLARSLKKEISLQMIGEDTDLDKNLVEALADPLVHLVRNSVDHGIEMPEDRANTGKSRSGTITLSAAQEGDHIMLVIEDDGKGMDPNVLREIAVDKGLMDKEHADRLTNNECYNLIFHAGFSTKKEISDISGRGVGMDVVKTKITQLNGSLDIESDLGKGTKILIKVPLTLAILPTLMVKTRGQAFAFPLTAVNEIFHLDLTKTNTVDGQLMIVVREKALPLFFLNEMLARGNSGEGRERQGHVVLAQTGTQTVGFVVDSLVGQEEVVIKPLGKSLQGTPGMAGATITSDGKIALILDIPSLLKHYVS